MNWEAIGAISEAIGVIGVIVSLIYLANQVKQSNHAAQAATVDQITGRFIDWMYTNAREPGLRKHFMGGVSSLMEAPDDEVMEFYAAVQSLFKIIEEIQYQRLKGFIDDDVWTGWENWFANMKSYDVMRHFYEMKKDNLSPRFRDYWENLTATPDSSVASMVKALRDNVPG